MAVNVLRAVGSVSELITRIDIQGAGNTKVHVALMLVICYMYTWNSTKTGKFIPFSLLVLTNAHIFVIYISPYVAPMCFGWSPCSGSSKPNSLKTHNKEESLCCYAYECTELC